MRFRKPANKKHPKHANTVISPSAHPPFPRFPIRPIHVVRIYTIKNSGSRHSGTSLCPGDVYPLKIRIGSGRSPKPLSILPSRIGPAPEIATRLCGSPASAGGHPHTCRADQLCIMLCTSCVLLYLCIFVMYVYCCIYVLCMCIVVCICVLLVVFVYLS